MTRPTIGSLCSGYGGLEMALTSVIGGEVAWHVENDPDASLVLKTHWPKVPNHGSVIGLDWSLLPEVDMLAGGVPCQSVSAAGRQLGDLDPRWLWPAYREALTCLQPRGFVFENVRNLVSIKGGSLWRGILADARDLGYAVRWLTMGACVIGACHHRHRVFALGVRVEGITPEAVRLLVPECGVPRGRPALPTPAARDGDGRGEGTREYWANRQRSDGRTNGAPLAATLIRTMLPSPRAADGRDGRGWENISGKHIRMSGVAQMWGEMLPTPRATDGVNGGPNQRGSSGDLAMPSAVQPERFGRFAWAVDRQASWSGEPPAALEVGPRGGNRLAPAFPEWMMGLPAGHVADVLGRNDAIRVIGNGVMPQQGAPALRLLLESFG
jgi:DNA (cytosine-5)-methyltransferase 1